MKTAIKISIIILALVASFTVGYYSRNKEYLDACRMSDAIRCYLDDIDNPKTEVHDNGTFREICDMFLWDDTIENSVVHLEDYSYCY